MTTPFNIIEESCQQGSFSKKDARKAVDLVVRPGGWGRMGRGGDHQGNRILTEKNQGGWVLIFFVGINARENQLGSLFFGGKTRRERGGRSSVEQDPGSISWMITLCSWSMYYKDIHYFRYVFRPPFNE